MKNESKKQPKTKEELNAIKNEVETMKGKLRELNENELNEITGGENIIFQYRRKCKDFKETSAGMLA